MTEDEVYNLDGEIVEVGVTINYLQKYINLINSNWETPCGGTESHHVYPRAFEDNIFDEYRVNLSYADHLKAHYYLYKIFDNEYSMKKAFKLMMDLDHWETMTEDDLEEMMPGYIKVKEELREEQSRSQTGTGNYAAKYNKLRWYHAETDKVEYATPAEMTKKYENKDMVPRADRPGQMRKPSGNFRRLITPPLTDKNIIYHVKGWVLDESSTWEE